MMILAAKLGVGKDLAHLVEPAKAPSNYKSQDALQGHAERARAAVGDQVMRTPACLEVTDMVLIVDHAKPAGVYRPNGPPASWFLATAAIGQPPVWCLNAKGVARAIAINCLRLGVKPVPQSLFSGDAFLDPFDAVFGPLGGRMFDLPPYSPDVRLHRDNCLRSVGITPPAGVSSVDEDLRVTRQLVERLS